MKRFLLIFSALFIFTGNLYGHKVIIFAWVEGDKVYTESKFAGGKKVKNGKIEVFNSNGKLLLKGFTNNNGEFSFDTPLKATLDIVLNAGAGHRGKWTLNKEEFFETEEEHPAYKSENNIEKGNSLNRNNLNSETIEITKEELEKVVEKALDKKLAPLKKMVAESMAGRSKFNDIIGGIGYILGLMGIAAYFKFKGEKGSEK